MGKKNYDDLDIFQRDQYLRKQAERYGIDTDDYQLLGNSAREIGGDRKSSADLRKDILSAARNDYDLRRGREAAALSGDKRAEGLDKGLDGMDDLYAYERFAKKVHRKDLGHGGQFSSANDYANITDYFVNKDRDNLRQSITDEINAGGTEEETSNDTEQNSMSYNDWRDQQGLEVGDQSPNTVVQLDGIDGSRRDAANSFLKSEIEKITEQDRARSKAVMGTYTLSKLAGN